MSRQMRSFREDRYTLLSPDYARELNENQKLQSGPQS